MSNIYTKLQKVRVDLQEMNLKKSGENKFAGYKYYELGDILPAINKLLLENHMTAVVTFDSEYARLKLINCEAVEETVEFMSPMAGVTLKGAHDIQNLGAVETYQRRYLYMMAFEVVESDFFDATQGKDTRNNGQQGKAGTSKPQAKAKPMSANMVVNLNNAVREYCKLTGTSNEVVMGAITKEIGKPAQAMNDADGKRVLELLNKWMEEYIPQSS